MRGVAQNHPSVVCYATSHNATGYSDDMNPDKIDGLYQPRRNAERALRAEAIIRRFDSSRVIYHHSSGNLGSMHTSNFYSNWLAIQEMEDWFEHWATQGVKPMMMCEFGTPWTMDWATYKGWYKGRRSFGTDPVPWEFCLAEWDSQFLGDQAYKITEHDKANLRWEAERFRAGEVWRGGSIPYNYVGGGLESADPVWAMHIGQEWRAFRTWEVSANCAWNDRPYWHLRDGAENDRMEYTVDWDNLQRPGFSPDYAERYGRMDLDPQFPRSDWIATPAAQAIIRNDGPLLAYIGGKPDAFTSKDHNFLAGETVEKQLIVINNCRQTVSCDCSWSLDLPQTAAGSKTLSVPTGQQVRIPLRFPLPAGLWRRQVRAERDGQVQQRRDAERSLRDPRAATGLGRETDREDRALGSQGRDGQVARRVGSKMSARRRRRRSFRLRCADCGQGRADARRSGAERGPREQGAEGDSVRADHRSAGEAVRLPRGRVWPPLCVSAGGRTIRSWPDSTWTTSAIGGARRRSSRPG